MLAGLRHGLTLGTPLALVVANRDHANWAWGMSPWPPEGERLGKGTAPVTLPRPGHADLAGALKFAHEDVRNALERGECAVVRGSRRGGSGGEGAPRRELGIRVEGRVVEIGGETSEEGRIAATDAARAAFDQLGGVVEVLATGIPPGLGSYAEKSDRLDARGSPRRSWGSRR